MCFANPVDFKAYDFEKTSYLNFKVCKFLPGGPFS